MQASRRQVGLVFILAAGLGACSESIDFTTPGRAPPASGDLVIEIDGTPRGFGAARLVKDGQGNPSISANIGTQSSASITLPKQASTVSCKELPNAIVLMTTSPLDHENTAYNEATWTATDCTITVARIDATGTKGAEGSLSGTLVRDKDTVGGKEIVGPKTLSVKATFIVSSP